MPITTQTRQAINTLILTITLAAALLHIKPLLLTISIVNVLINGQPALQLIALLTLIIVRKCANTCSKYVANH